MSRTLSKSVSAVKGTETISKNLNITNNSGTEIVVINASTSDDSDVNQLYQQTLTLLKTSTGQGSVKNSSTATLSLHSGDTFNTIILARADNFFPVKLVTLSGTEISVTASQEDVDIMKQSDAFYKTVSAFPSTEMAKSFAAAVNDGDDSVIQAFFPKYASFSKCTLDTVVAIITYYKRFPLAWTGNAASKTYYLYTSDGTTNKYVGSVAMENQLVTPLSSVDTSEGFITNYITTNGADATELYYQNGQFVENKESETPAFCLAGIFIQKSQLTKIDQDDMIIPVLKGTVNGKDVLGYDVKQERDKDGVFSQLNALVHPEDTKGVLELIGVIVVAVAGIFVLGVAAKCLVDFLKKSKKLTPEEIAAKNTEIKARNRQNVQETLNKMTGPANEKPRIPEDVNESLSRVISDGNKLMLKQNRSMLMDAATKQQDMYNKLIEYGNPSAMKKVETRLGEIAEVLEKNSWEMAPDMPRMVENLKFNATTLNEQAVKSKSKFSTAENKAMEESGKTLETITKNVEQNEKIREELLEEKVPEIPVEEY